MATISNVNGKKITKIKFEDEIYDVGGGSGGGGSLKTLLDATKSCYYLFYNYQGTSVDGLISYSDTSSVTDMGSMFSGSPKLTTIPQLNTIKVTNMANMFNSCSNLTTIPQLDTSSVTNMADMFYNCENLESDIDFITSNTTSLVNTFFNCTKIKNIHLSDTQKVTNFYQTFRSCYSLLSVSPLNTNKASRMEYMFGGCYLLPTIDITKLVNSSSGFASNCYSLTKLVIRNMPTIPTLETNAFGNCYHFTGKTNATYNPQGLKDGRIYVPDDKVDALKTATNWSVYADIIVPLSTLVE